MTTKTKVTSTIVVKLTSSEISVIQLAMRAFIKGSTYRGLFDSENVENINQKLLKAIS